MSSIDVFVLENDSSKTHALFCPSQMRGFACAKTIIFDVRPEDKDNELFFKILALSPTVKLKHSGEVTMRFTMDCIVTVEIEGGQEIITVSPADDEQMSLIKASRLICAKINGKVSRQISFQCNLNECVSLNPEVSDR